MRKWCHTIMKDFISTHVAKRSALPLRTKRSEVRLHFLPRSEPLGERSVNPNVVRVSPYARSALTKRSEVSFPLPVFSSEVRSPYARSAAKCALLFFLPAFFFLSPLPTSLHSLLLLR